MKGVVSPALVGRAAELERVAAAVSAPPAVVVVDGEAGIGKTRLVTELARRPELSGRRVLLGRCHRIRESFPLGPVVEAVRGLGEDLARVPLSPIVGALRPLVPELADLLPPAPARLDERAADRHRVFRALVEVLTSVSPVVLVLEDLHWADEQTVDFAGYLLAEAPPEMSVVLTFRGEEVDPRVRSAVAKPPAATRRTDIRLQPLGERDTGALAAAIVGADHVSEEFAAYLCERTSGLPFAIEELLALLRARGKLVRRGGSWARRTLDELDVPTGIRDPVLERLAHLSSSAKSVVEAAAVLQVPVPLEALVGTCRVRRAEALPGVEDSLESGLLAEYDDAVGFRHLLAAQAVYEEIPGPRRRDLHGRAAAALASVVPLPLGQVAHHLRQAGRLDEWVGAAERAADQALGLGHDEEAFRLLEDVLRHAPLEPDRRGRLAVRLGQAAIETLQARDVVELLSAVLDQELPAAVRSELQFLVGRLLHEVGGDPAQSRQLLAEAVEGLHDRPDLQAWAMIVLGIPMVDGVELAEHRRWLERALKIVPNVPDPVAQVFLLGKAAMLLAPFGDPQWRNLTGRIEELAGTPRDRRQVNAYWSVGNEACYIGDHATADRLLTTGLAGAIEGENRRMELGLRAGLALLRYCTGSWDGLDDEVDVLVEQLAGAPRSRVDVEVAGNCLRLVRGDVAVADDRLTAVVDFLEKLGGFDLLPIPAASLIRVSLARGDLEKAVSVSARVQAAAEAKEVWPSVLRALPAITEALIAAGRTDDARAFADRCADKVRGLDAPLAPAGLEHASGVLAKAAGKHREAAERFAGAADRYDALHSPYEAAIAAEQAALCLFAAEDHRAAESMLQVAMSGFRRLGASWDAGRATKLARERGVRVPARHRGGRRGYGGELSPREREVAELAATGRTNKEIAGELFLSVNTVARHISAAMKKLDVRSRAALAHRLAGRADDQN